ncbi:MAG: TatD family hydrolase, partial [Flavobacteriales bacterium]|nr:TatD family hydrolase [Flavobacteriales bacterium]
MILTDTHSHLYAEQFNEDIDQVMSRCLADGINRIFLPNIDESSINAMLSLEETYPNTCFPMMGIHPCSVNENFKEQLSVVKSWLNKREFVAIGEIGIDLYWDKTLLSQQKEAFRTQIEWAKELGKPIIIHARDSFDEIFEIVDELNDDRLSGIFHCFTGSLEQAEKIINYQNFWLGIGGVLTFKNSGLDKVIKEVALKQLV